MTFIGTINKANSTTYIIISKYIWKVYHNINQISAGNITDLKEITSQDWNETFYNITFFMPSDRGEKEREREGGKQGENERCQS